MMSDPIPMPFPGRNGWPPDGCESVLHLERNGTEVRLGFRSDEEAMAYAEREAGKTLEWTWQANQGGLVFGYADGFMISDPWKGDSH